MVRFGIVGFGLHAIKRLMPGFAEAQNCRVTALSRRSLEVAKASAREYKIPLAFDSGEALCRSSEVDAVFVATPNSRHLPDTLLALSCGKPVLVEKPMALNAQECRQMLNAAQRANLLLGVAQVFRFEESTAWLRERIASGGIGKVIFARAEFSFPGRGHVRKWLTDASISGGGPIADVGVHCMDTLRFILADEVISVSARTKADEESGQVESAAILTLEFARGTLAAVLVSTRAEYRTPLEIVGENGTLRAEDGLNVEYPIHLQLWRGKKLIEEEKVVNSFAYAKQVDAFAAALERRRTFPASGVEGLRNQLVLDAAYISARTGTTQSVEELGTSSDVGHR